MKFAICCCLGPGATVLSVTDPAGRTELFVGLAELNDSGHTGVVRFGVGDDPNQTEVVVMLIEPDAMQYVWATT